MFSIKASIESLLDTSDSEAESSNEYILTSGVHTFARGILNMYLSHNMDDLTLLTFLEKILFLIVDV